MKKKLTVLFILFLIPLSGAFSQFDKFSFQLGAGITNPDKDLRGSNYIYYSNSYRYINRPLNIDTTFILPFQAAFVDTSLIAKNYGAKTGFSIFGVGKLNLDKYETVRLIASLSFSTFNSFEGSKTGYIPVFTQNYIQQSPISYDYSFNNFGLGLGVEVAPLSFTKFLTPFVNGQFNFNFMSAQLVRTTSVIDSTKLQFSDFRMGFSLAAGLEFRITPQWGIVAAAKYDFGNLLLKNTDRASMIEWGNTNASINDAEGYFTSNIYDPPGTPVRDNIKSNEKVINWATFYIGVNFYPNVAKKK